MEHVKATPTMAASPSSVWEPLRLPLFRAIWIAAVASNVGSWMHDAAASWYMAQLSSSAVVISLMQTASSLPLFLLALPAGTLADIVNRRRLLILSQTLMLLAAFALAVLTFFHAVEPWTLLLLTFFLGVGTALNQPAWWAIMPDILPRNDLQAGITLNGVANNLARAVGPALGGFLVAASGPGVVFLLNALSFVGVIYTLYRWRAHQDKSPLPAERLASGISLGIRYARHAPDLTAILLRTAAFIVFGSALWGLFPILALKTLGLGSLAYGVLYGFIGAGAVAGATLMPRLRAKGGIETLYGGSIVLYALALIALAYVRSFPLLCAIMACAGAAWISIMATLNASAQLVVPSWVRARAMAMYLVVAQGGMAIGSACWGMVTQSFGIEAAFALAAGGCAIGLAATIRLTFTNADSLDFSPSDHWPRPTPAQTEDLEQGPVLVMFEYRVDENQRGRFLAAAEQLRLVRRRSGATRWRIFHDIADPSRMIETFMVKSWAEHLRQYERISVADRQVEDLVLSYHRGEGRPKVTQLMGEETRHLGPLTADAGRRAKAF